MLTLFCLCRRGSLSLEQLLFTVGQDGKVDRFAQLRKDLSISKLVVCFGRSAGHDIKSERDLAQHILTPSSNGDEAMTDVLERPGCRCADPRVLCITEKLGSCGLSSDVKGRSHSRSSDRAPIAELDVQTTVTYELEYKPKLHCSTYYLLLDTPISLANTAGLVVVKTRHEWPLQFGMAARRRETNQALQARPQLRFIPTRDSCYLVRLTLAVTIVRCLAI
jgi:hypothetical protein